MCSLVCSGFLKRSGMPCPDIFIHNILNFLLHLCTTVFFLLKVFAKVFKFVFPAPTYILNHPFLMIMTNNTVDDFFVFLASPFARNKFIYI